MPSNHRLTDEYATYLSALDTSDIEDIVRKIDDEKYPKKKEAALKELASRKPRTIQGHSNNHGEPHIQQHSDSSYLNLFPLHCVAVLCISIFILLPLLPHEYLSPALDWLGGIMLFAGAIICSLYWLNIIMLAFRFSILLGLSVLILPFIGLEFVFDNWEQAGSAFVKSLLGIPLVGIGLFLLILERQLMQ